MPCEAAPIVTCVGTIKRGINVTERRVPDNEFAVAQIGDHETIFNNNYSVKQLKAMCKWHKLKLSGTKIELQSRLYELLHLSFHARRIQRAWRNHLVTVCNRLRGPAAFKRNECVNDTDFFSMENLDNVTTKQFFSYKCQYDGKVYGFDFNSIYKLIDTGGAHNPYTRNPLPVTIEKDLIRLVILSNIIHQPIELSAVEEEELTPTKRLELEAVSLFQSIDSLGNISTHEWFWALRRTQLIRFIHALADIWGYRAQLQDSVKRDICPPHGEPFRGVDLTSIADLQQHYLRIAGMRIMESMVNRGIDAGARSLGANYVLCALTLVNHDAANALPWLYEAVVQTH